MANSSPTSSLELGRDDLLLSKEVIPIRPRDRPPTSAAFHLAILYFALAVQMIALFAMAYRLEQVSGTCTHEDQSLQGVYSPAETVVEYEMIDFNGRLHDKSPYMGFPTNETDRLWRELYDFGTSHISEDETARLHPNTLRVPGNDGYLVELDVFHQLRCLDEVRKALYPQRYHNWKWNEDGSVNYEAMDWGNWDRCIDELRQALMCHGDITPLTHGLEATHQCRNFAKIQQWAKLRKADKPASVQM